MAYSPPNLAALRTNVQRDVRDPDGNVFSTTQIADFINDGITELNQSRPLEMRVELAGDDALSGSGLQDVFQVQYAIDDDAGLAFPWVIIPYSVDSGYNNGWDYFGGTLEFSPEWQRAIDRAVVQRGADHIFLALYGYGDRDLLSDDADVAGFVNAMDERIVRSYSRLQGYRALNSDRMLFQQWQQQANNSDISETQLQGSVYGFEAEFDRLRKRTLLIRRPAV